MLNWLHTKKGDTCGSSGSITQDSLSNKTEVD